MAYPEILPPELMPAPAVKPQPAPPPRTGRPYRGAREILPPPGGGAEGMGLSPETQRLLADILRGTAYLGPQAQAAVRPPEALMLAEALRGPMKGGA